MGSEELALKRCGHSYNFFVTDLIENAFVGVSLSEAKFTGEEYSKWITQHELLMLALVKFMVSAPLLNT